MMMIFPLLTQVSTFTSFLMKWTVPNRVSSGIKVRIERDNVNFSFKWAAITDTYSCIEVKVKVLVAQLCLTLCDPMDCSPPGSSAMEFSRQEYWSGLPFPFSRGSSQPRDWTRVFCVAGRFFTIWSIREGWVYSVQWTSLRSTREILDSGYWELMINLYSELAM